jgi:hypothetical protein
MNTKKFSFWFWAGLISLAVIAFVYYQGLTSDAQVILPYVIQLGELAQGRNPLTGNFSNYPGTNSGSQSK